MANKQKPTTSWFLLPIFFGIIGGLIGYAKVRDRDKSMANMILIVGIVFTFIAPFIWLAIIGFFYGFLTRIFSA